MQQKLQEDRIEHGGIYMVMIKYQKMQQIDFFEMYSIL